MLQNDYPIAPVPFSAVLVKDRFWRRRIDTNTAVTIPSSFKKCEETGRIRNFRVAAGDDQGEIVGRYPFDDTDAYKTIEGAAYSLATSPNPELDQYLDTLINTIAAAQMSDGYLFTWAAKKDAKYKSRWAELQQSHETYNAGHLYEAAAAHFEATGKRSLLDIAIRNADLHVRVFHDGGLRIPSGHQEIELGLVRLFRVTGKREYLDLARFFLDQRGHYHDGRESMGTYAQDHAPVLEQDEAVGHAVRAAYMYAAMTDVAALMGDKSYADAVGRLWDNVVRTKLYITGGIGATGDGERFDDNYFLPNDTAYNETCAAIAYVMWNHRMFLLHGEASYMDMVERTLYNGFLSGVSLDGDTFFYPNPLASDGTTAFNEGLCVRSPWFVCSCCPVNVARFVPSVPGYVYAVRNDDLYVNLYMTSVATMIVRGVKVAISQDTDYPWDGAVRFTVSPKAPAKFALRLRVPGWAQGQPVPSDLYWYRGNGEQLKAAKQNVRITVNGTTVKHGSDHGYAVIERAWKPGDTVVLSLPMPVRLVECTDKVAANRGKIALERGPIVYCVEGVDNGGSIAGLGVAHDTPLDVVHRADMFDGVHTIVSGNGEHKSFTAIPYYAWAHRGPSPMSVWLDYKK